ncbi:ACT domain-containing protein [Vibrio sp. 99-70-13A1]|uniref:glycine cleavage system protein R n=1 Tax=Vibrio sp. 99-70-13A1 TaxID=2607601 RepID=UPI0014936A2E|nr:ACT domain-containing protein [Vibrio sp. 99-70-13A1]NOH95162.1 transcriptional regulator [Vibrio sp. 99-70-13A1]
MNSTFIANFIGKASPTTIKQLAAITHENDGKWLISKVNFIEDQVAGVIKIQLPSANESIVKEAFSNHAELTVQFLDSDHSVHSQDTIFQLRVDSNDRAGIVNEITHVLDNQGISILDMDCQRVFIAGGGGVSSSLFTAKIALKLPMEVQISDVANELETLSEDTRVILES